MRSITKISVVLVALFVAVCGVEYAMTRSMPTEVKEFVDATEKLNASKLVEKTIAQTEHLTNGDTKRYYVLAFEKNVEDGKVVGKDGITITWKGGQTIRFEEKVVLTYDKDGNVVQRTCWNSDGGILSQTVYKK